MIWPTVPTCHAAERQYPGHEPRWREPRRDGEPYGEDFRTCFYCGSIHPEDLVRHLAAGASLHGADWKYGWPHKLYVEGIPNLHPAGKQVESGARYWTDPDGTRREEKRYSPAPPTVFAKWYNQHLLDDGYDAEALRKLLDALGASGITFQVIDGKIRYTAPGHGYQK